MIAKIINIDLFEMMDLRVNGVSPKIIHLAEKLSKLHAVFNIGLILNIF